MTPAPKSSAVRRLRADTTNESSELDRYYSLVGKVISCCEAGSITAGIPWLPPTSRVRRLRSELDRPLGEFVRVNLVGIPTPVLEAYCNDLETWPADDVSSANLRIALGSPVERFGFAALTFVAVCAIGIWAAMGINLWSVFSATLAFLCGASIVLLATMFCSEGYRRASFCWLISSEIQRRHGGGSNQKPERIQEIYTAPVKPISNGVH